MSLLQTPSWELQLVSVAREALHSQRIQQTIEADRSVLDAAYAHCEQITRDNSRTFFMASSLLKPEQRKAVRALYAFCRVTDDIVDDPHASLPQRTATLACWRDTVMGEQPKEGELVCLAWADTQAKFSIPRGYAHQLIDGCERDIEQQRYQTFDDLAAYAYGVASTVGLMAMHIVGFESEDAIPYAVRLGVALQITNILRDVREDLKNGRVYLPQDELDSFGVTDDALRAGVLDENWKRFMAFQIERNRHLYQTSLKGISMLDRSGRFAIAAAAQLYRAILDDIEQHDYDVFSRRSHVSTFGKLRRLPGIWLSAWRSQLQ